MLSWLVPIIVAVISGPVVVLLQRLRKENTEQHAESRHILTHMLGKVDDIGSKLDSHIGWHDARKE